MSPAKTSAKKATKPVAKKVTTKKAAKPRKPSSAQLLKLRASWEHAATVSDTAQRKYRRALNSPSNFSVPDAEVEALTAKATAILAADEFMAAKRAAAA